MTLTGTLTQLFQMWSQGSGARPTCQETSHFRFQNSLTPLSLSLSLSFSLLSLSLPLSIFLSYPSLFFSLSLSLLHSLTHLSVAFSLVRFSAGNRVSDLTVELPVWPFLVIFLCAEGQSHLP